MRHKDNLRRRKTRAVHRPSVSPSTPSSYSSGSRRSTSSSTWSSVSTRHHARTRRCSPSSASFSSASSRTASSSSYFSEEQQRCAPRRELAGRGKAHSRSRRSNVRAPGTHEEPRLLRCPQGSYPEHFYRRPSFGCCAVPSAMPGWAQTQNGALTSHHCCQCGFLPPQAFERHPGNFPLPLAWSQPWYQQHLLNEARMAPYRVRRGDEELFEAMRAAPLSAACSGVGHAPLAAHFAPVPWPAAQGGMNCKARAPEPRSAARPQLAQRTNKALERERIIARLRGIEAKQSHGQASQAALRIQSCWRGHHSRCSDNDSSRQRHPRNSHAVKNCRIGAVQQLVRERSASHPTLGGCGSSAASMTLASSGCQANKRNGAGSCLSEGSASRAGSGGACASGRSACSGAGALPRSLTQPSASQGGMQASLLMKQLGRGDDLRDPTTAPCSAGHSTLKQSMRARSVAPKDVLPSHFSAVSSTRVSTRHSAGAMGDDEDPLEARLRVAGETLRKQVLERWRGDRAQRSRRFP
mmetsp:Transcript_37903/g.85395  ORF Transcript_37903/g.85395 Transcript_37903/m.85395 type:complete len:524 (-) Transcript_37903:33-1604(-)